MGKIGIILSAVFTAAALASGCKAETAKPTSLPQQEWDACLARMEQARMPAEEHCSVVTVPFSRLSPPQQSVLTKFHLFYNCAEPLWEASAAHDHHQHGTSPEPKTDAYAYCAEVAGVTYEGIRQQSFVVIDELTLEEEQALQRPLTEEEKAAFVMLFHRPYMPIEGFTQPSVPAAPKR